MPPIMDLNSGKTGNGPEGVAGRLAMWRYEKPTLLACPPHPKQAPPTQRSSLPTSTALVKRKTAVRAARRVAASSPASEVVALYAQRWRIETLLREVKIDLSADVLRSQTSAGIRKEMIARLTALNVVRTLILQAAQDGDIDPLRISFVDTLRTILSFSAVLASAPVPALPELHHAMLAEIAGHVIPERPGPLEPRYLTGERKHYPALRRQTRAQWRARQAA
jgi:Transposase DDE domain